MTARGATHALPLRGAALCALLFALGACAAGTSESLQAAQGGAISELVLGFWHGILAPITLIGEIIKQISPGTLTWSFGFYEGSHVTVLYDVGFYVGVVAGPSILLSGVSRRRGGGV